MTEFRSKQLAAAMVENAVAGDDAYRAVLDELARLPAASSQWVVERLASIRDLLGARSPATVRQGGDELRAFLDDLIAADLELGEALAARWITWRARLESFGRGPGVPDGEVVSVDPGVPHGEVVPGNRGVPHAETSDGGLPDVAYGRPPGPPTGDVGDW